jgi:hypothetical protein
MRHDETGKYEKVKCPHCNSKRKNKLVSGCKISFVNPEGTDLYEGSHDYRYHHTMNKPGGTKDQRKIAEETSHVGPTPYSGISDIDDISSGKHFGEVK